MDLFIILGSSQGMYLTIGLLLTAAISLFLISNKPGKRESNLDGPDWIEEISKFEKPTNKMVLQEMEHPCQPISCVGGAPWWPKGIERPRCEKGHFMSFISQIDLSDLPDPDEPISGLCSFHYCIECQHKGNMSFGWSDKQNKGYDVRVFQDLNVDTDGLGILSDPVIPPRTVEFEKIEEVPNLSDLPVDVAEMVPDKFFKFTPPDIDNYKFIPSDWVWHNLKHVHGSKIGGHPTWIQNPEWPSMVSGKRMIFLAQLDGLIGDDAAWANGTAYLFIHKRIKGTYVGEMGLQHT